MKHIDMYDVGCIYVCVHTYTMCMYICMIRTYGCMHGGCMYTEHVLCVCMCVACVEIRGQLF